MINKKATSFQKERETKEHNEMLKDFLDKNFRFNFYKLVYPDQLIIKNERSYTLTYKKRKIVVVLKNPESEIYVNRPDHESNGIDISFNYTIFYNDIKEAYYEDNLHTIRDVEDIDTSFETEKLNIEIRPIVSEDFNSLLSQMKKINANCLYLREYCGKGMNESQFKEIFESQGIKVIFEKQLKLDNN